MTKQEQSSASGSSDLHAASRSPQWPALALLMALALAHGLIYAFGIPRWQAPDEPMLFEYAGLAAALGRTPAAWERSPELERAIAASLARERFYRYTLGQEPAAPPATLDEARALFYMPRQVGGDPPLYFALASLPLRLLPGWSVEAQLSLLRLLNALLLPAAVACVYLAAHAILGGPACSLAPVAAAALVALHPMAVSVGAAMGNDALANLLGALLCLLLVRIVGAGLRGRDLALFGGLTLLALAVKRTALPYALMALGLAPIWLGRRLWAAPDARRRRLTLAAALLIPLLALAWLAGQLVWDRAGAWYDARTLAPAPREPAAAGYALTLQPGQEVIQVLPNVATVYLRNNVVRVGARVWGDGGATGRLVLYIDDRRQELPFAVGAAAPELSAPVPAYARNLRLGIVADSGRLYVADAWARGVGLPGNLIANGDLRRPAFAPESPLQPALRYVRAEELLWALGSGRLAWGLPLGQWAEWLFVSFWGHFGWFSIAFVRGSAWAWALGAMCAAGLIGVAVDLARRPERRAASAVLLCLCAVALVPLLLNALVDSHPIQQGRYLFPVLPAVAILMALGQEALLPARWRAGWLIAWLGFWLIFAAAALVRLAAAYR
jgi:hypothetical protein